MSRWPIVLVLLSGCAFGLSAPDPERPRHKVPECDTGKGLVALDAVVGTTLALVAMSLASESEPEIALLPAAISALYFGGAIRGNSNVNQCRAAMNEFSSGMTVERDPRYVPDERAQEEMRPRRKRIDNTTATTELDPDNTQPTTGRQVAPEPQTQPQQPQPQQPQAQPQAQPQPQPQPAQPQPQPAKSRSKKAPKPAEADEEWTDFWREVQ